MLVTVKGVALFHFLSLGLIINGLYNHLKDYLVHLFGFIVVLIPGFKHQLYVFGANNHSIWICIHLFLLFLIQILGPIFLKAPLIV